MCKQQGSTNRPKYELRHRHIMREQPFDLPWIHWPCTIVPKSRRIDPTRLLCILWKSKEKPIGDVRKGTSTVRYAPMEVRKLDDCSIRRYAGYCTGCFEVEFAETGSERCLMELEHNA
jgi:hypothetical protein